jgi:predicted nucleic acid-binding Zn finger protein
VQLKRHSFAPSGRVIWTAIGSTYEYWLDLDLNYCTCNDYFFRTLSGKGLCYHLNSALEQVRSENYEEVLFRDEEYSAFLAAIISDCLSKLRISDKS